MCETAIMPSGHRESRIDEFPTLPRRLIRTHFVDKNIMITANRIRENSVRAYNFTVVNSDTIRRALTREPQTADYFLSHALPWEKVDRSRPARISQAQYEEILQDKLGLNAGERKYLEAAARLYQEEIYSRYDDKTTPGIRKFCQDMADAGVSPGTAAAVASRGRSAYKELSNSPGGTGAAFRAMLALYDTHQGARQNAPWLEREAAAEVMVKAMRKIAIGRLFGTTWEPRTWKECEKAAGV